MFLLRALHCEYSALTVRIHGDDIYGLGGLHQTAVASVAIAQRLVSSIFRDSFLGRGSGWATPASDSRYHSECMSVRYIYVVIYV